MEFISDGIFWCRSAHIRHTSHTKVTNVCMYICNLWTVCSSFSLFSFWILYPAGYPAVLELYLCINIFCMCEKTIIYFFPARTFFVLKLKINQFIFAWLGYPVSSLAHGSETLISSSSLVCRPLMINESEMFCSNLFFFHTEQIYWYCRRSRQDPLWPSRGSLESSIIRIRKDVYPLLIVSRLFCPLNCL